MEIVSLDASEDLSIVNDKPLFPSVKSFAKKAVSTGLMLTMLYSGAAKLNASTESSLESSTGYFEKVDANNGVKKNHKSALPWIIVGGVVVGAAIYFFTQKKDDPIPPQPEYLVSVDAKAMVEGFPALDGAKILFNNNQLNPGESYKFVVQNNNYILDLYVTGGHDTVLCVRSPTGKTNISQSQNGQHIKLNVMALPEDAKNGSNVSLVAYKIPSSMNIAGIKEALSDGTAVYQSPVTFYPVNEGYPVTPNGVNPSFDQVRIMISKDANDILKQISSIYGVPKVDCDANKTSGNQRVRLNPEMSNPAHIESGSGVMTWSEIKIRHDVEIWAMLEEFYQSMGVRNDIGSGLSDDINNHTKTLNQFGRNLMLIDYFLNPNTKL